MDILDVLLNPGLIVGCLVGIAGAVALQWLFPSHDLSVVQAILVIACAVAGLIFQYKK